MKLPVAALTVAVLTACPGPTCPEPFYDGKASDEAWRTLADGEARAKQDDAKAVKLFAPTEGASFSGASAPTFNWTTPLTAAARSPAQRPAILSQLGALLYGTAWAHLPPVTGPAHLLRISVPGRTCAIEVVTTKNEWIPNTGAWTQLQGTAGQSLSLDVYSAYLQENRISEGPFHFTKPLKFAVSK